MAWWRGAGLIAAVLVAAAPPAATIDYAGDARALDRIVAENYAYLDRFGGTPPRSPALDAERDAVHDHDSLLRYAEDVMTALADHHAITGSAFKDSWALVPSYADLWIVADGDSYRVDAVKPDSPAATAGIVAGERLIAIDGRPAAEAVAAFWAKLGLPVAGERGPTPRACSPPAGATGRVR